MKKIYLAQKKFQVQAIKFVRQRQGPNSSRQKKVQAINFVASVLARLIAEES